MRLGRHMTKSWSSTQPGVTLSSGEAELCGVIRGSGMGLGFQSLMKDLGQDMPIRVWTDSSAAIGVIGRMGIGKLRHIEVQDLWLQEAQRQGRLQTKKTPGEWNDADLGTKPLGKQAIGTIMRRVGFRAVVGGGSGSSRAGS